MFITHDCSYSRFAVHWCNRIYIRLVVSSSILQSCNFSSHTGSTEGRCRKTGVLRQNASVSRCVIVTVRSLIWKKLFTFDILSTLSAAYFIHLGYWISYVFHNYHSIFVSIQWSKQECGIRCGISMSIYLVCASNFEIIFLNLKMIRYFWWALDKFALIRFLPPTTTCVNI